MSYPLRDDEKLHEQVEDLPHLGGILPFLTRYLLARARSAETRITRQTITALTARIAPHPSVANG